jgi:hypothetical protein
LYFNCHDQILPGMSSKLENNNGHDCPDTQENASP